MNFGDDVVGTDEPIKGERVGSVVVEVVIDVAMDGGWEWKYRQTGGSGVRLGVLGDDLKPNWYHIGK